MNKLMLVVPAAAGAALLALASPAYAATPKIALTPAKNVKNHGTITVKGTGYPKNTTIDLAECSSASPSKATTACDYATFVQTKTSAKGSFTAKIKVHTGAVGNGTCKAGKTCYIGAGNPVDRSVAASGKFTFAK